MVAVRVRKLRLGRIVCTAAIAAQFDITRLTSLLQRHEEGDWGDISDTDKLKNDEALVSHEEVLSAYNIGNDHIWILTEWDRSATTILFPEER